MASPAGGKIRVAVIENDPIRLIGLRSILGSEPDFEVSTNTLSTLPSSHENAVVLLGSRVGPDVYRTIAELKNGQPEARILMAGAGKGDEDILRAIAAGAKGYLYEGALPAEFTRAIRVVHDGSVWAPRRVLSMFIERIMTTNRPAKSGPLFTERETEVLHLLVEGRSNREIGVALGIEVRTVKMHVARLMQKAGVQNRIALSVFVIRHALLPRQG